MHCPLTNFVARCTVDCSFEATNFFSFRQNLTTYFSATNRWEVLHQNLQNPSDESDDKNKPLLVVKSLSQTRWSALDHNCFGFLYNFSDECSDVSIDASAAKLAGLYKTYTYIYLSFCNEMKQWPNLMKSERSAGNCKRHTRHCSVEDDEEVGAKFANVETAPRIYFILSVSNCESECSKKEH